MAGLFKKKEKQPETTDIVNNAENQENSITQNFEQSIKVEGIKSTVDISATPTYQGLTQDDSVRVESFFRHITRDEFENYAVIENSEGISTGGEPFKCFAETNGTGNVIVTPNKIISIVKGENGSEEYSETRRQMNGDSVIVKFKRNHGDITTYSVNINPGNLSATDLKKSTKLQEFYSNPNNFPKLELTGKKPEEQSMYLQELQKLGVQIAKYKAPESMQQEEYVQAKNAGKVACVASNSTFDRAAGFQNVNALYKSEGGDPDTIWTAKTGANGENLQFQSYRLTAEGKYLDTASFKLVNGKTVYNLLEKEEVDELLFGQSVNVDKAYRVRRAAQEQLTEGFPKEAETISKHAQRMREREKDKDVQEEVHTLGGERSMYKS